MKKLLSLLFIVCSSLIFAQVGLKISNIRPTGSLGAAVKPTIGGEVTYSPYDYDGSGFRTRISIGFVKFTPRKDTFPTYGVISSSGTTVTPGYTVIHKYNITTLSIGADYMFQLNNSLFLYPGMDVGALFSGISYDSYAPLISSEGYSGGYVFLSTRFRLGAEYRIKEKFSLFFECTRSMNFSPEVGGLAYNDYGLGLRFIF